MTFRDIPHARLHNQHLTHPDFTTVLDTVEWLGAVQAQEYPGGQWTIGLRMKSADQTTVDEAIAARKIIRTWPMRGTLHFVPAADAKWMLKLLTPRVIRKMASYLRKAEVDEKVLSKARKVAENALVGDKQLTRDELYRVWNKQGIETKSTRGLFILDTLAQQQVLCFGVKQGNQQTLVLFDEWVKKSTVLDDDEALALLTLRYFQSHGPAQIKDCMWWAGLTTVEVKKGLELNKDKIDSEIIGDKEYFFVGKPNTTPKTQNTTFLLPAYDEYTVAYKDRSDITPDQTNNVLYTQNGFWSAMILEGKVVGMWRRTIKKDVITVELAPVIKLTADQKEQFEEAAGRYAKFFNSEVKVAYKST